MQPSQNTLVTEIILGIVAGPMAIAAPVLLYLGTINLGGALTIWGIAAGLVVGKLALNAPSSTQQQQLGTLQAQQNAQNVNLQQLVQYALSVLQPQAPVAPPQPQQAAPLVMPSTSDPAMTPTVSPAPGTALHALINSSTVGNPVGTATLSTLTPVVVQPGSSAVPGTPPMQTQFKTIQIPDVSLPTIPVVGQGIPLGQ